MPFRNKPYGIGALPERLLKLFWGARQNDLGIGTSHYSLIQALGMSVALLDQTRVVPTALILKYDHAIADIETRAIHHQMTSQPEVLFC